MKYSWRAESAGPAKTAWQWQLDSIRLDHEKQAQVIQARQEAQISARVAAQNRSYRSCVVGYLRPNGGAVQSKGEESPIETIVRVCATRFPDAEPLSQRNLEYLDSLVIAFGAGLIK